MNLNKMYNLGDERIQALNDVSLELYPGEMVAIVGRPGAGKSTLLHILGCLQRPDSGQVLIDDQDMTQLGVEELARVRANKIGFLFQAFNLLPKDTVLTNVAVPLSDSGLEGQEVHDMARKALRLVGMENRIYHKVSRLPARYRQRIPIARAVVNDPEIICADEPTLGVDSSSREEVMGLFQKLNDQSKTIIIATSESSLANYCRRTVRMAEGRTVDNGLVTRRRIIAPSTLDPLLNSEISEEEAVCPRCNYGNPRHQENCQRCQFTLSLTREDEQSIKSRLSGTQLRWVGVESASDEGDVPAQDLIEELKEVSFLAGLGSKALLKLIPPLERRHFPKGSVIVKQGDPADSFYLIRSGDVQVVLSKDGKPVAAVATLGPKEGFGEMALLTDQPDRSFTIIAKTDAEVWRLPKGAFNELLSENLSLSLYFNRILSQRLTAIQKRVYPALIGEACAEGGDLTGGGAPEASQGPTSSVHVDDASAPRLIIRTGGRLIPLERTLGGGLPRESLTLLEGGTSARKSVLSQHLAYGALLEGDGVAYFTPEYTADSLTVQMNSLGLAVSSYVRENKLEVYNIPEPTAVGGPERLLGLLADDVERLPSLHSLIILDDITDLASYCEDMAVIRLFSSIKSLCKHGRTSILVARTHAFDEQMLNRLENLCDAHFSLRVEQLGAKMVNTLEVNKVNNLKPKTGNVISFEVESGLGIRILPVRQVRA